MLALLKGMVLVAIVGYVTVLLMVYLFQSKLVYVPYRTLEATPADVGLAFEEVRFVCGEETIHGWYMPADSPKGSVLFCHGNGGNISHRLETLLLLNRLGMNMLIFDYQGYGLSTGSPSEQGTYDAARGGWDWLVETRAEAPERIVVMGRSLGGAVAAQLAATLPKGERPAGLVLESTFTSAPDMGARMYPLLPVRLLSRFSYDTRSRLEQLHTPVLFAHSQQDDIVAYELGHELFDLYTGDKVFLEMTGDHNSGFLLTGSAYVDGLEMFFERSLESNR